jgi:plasmid stability protein
VKNITIAVEDEVYRRARIRAAQDDTSVSALVRDFLIQLASQEDTAERLKKLQEQTRKKIKKFRAADRLGRTATHER